MSDFMYEELLRQEREQNQERPRAYVPQMDVEYLRYIEEQERKKKEETEEKSDRGVYIIQM